MRLVPNTLAVISFTAIAALVAPLAVADTSDATCTVHRKGDLKKKQSGPCQFSQHQGNVSITLTNGSVWNLTAGKKANNFHDQEGHKVVREMEGQDAVYKWDQRKIKVAFNSGNSGSNKSQGGKGEAGHNVPELQDLVGQTGGEPTDKLQSRGYKMMNNSNSGNTNYSNWKNKKTGQCITLRSENGLFRSIVYATDYDCQQGG